MLSKIPITASRNPSFVFHNVMIAEARPTTSVITKPIGFAAIAALSAVIDVAAVPLAVPKPRMTAAAA